MIDLSGKVAVVTGSGRGLGKGIVMKLASLGAETIVSDIDDRSIQETVQEIQSYGGKAFGKACNVSQPDEAEEFVQEVIARYGTIDILVNNAGINRDAMMHKMSVEEWQQVMNVNINGVFYMMQPAVKVMREKESGSVINISSASWQGNIGQANYAAAKAGVIGLTKTAAKELGKKGVTVNAICPGFIETDMTRGVPDHVWDMMVNKIALGRAGQPEDVANCIAFLASEQANYITGEVINVGGGMVL
ncbi:3-oxoacyl-[acyl-carrier protein] reductase [Geomicrobium sp. JCM 19037]|uniref:3-oxoacyl-ACP reductase FabG n=1 Tax=Geomicrobium sp. JCM 19037 TaxID=1460634 RepID=UPI00045F190C|nr:3-oxoacyl-ACP reductase FabG [Geomicrobium sp. JCM 19037]GAK06286.1 3-oxoacyl-[acyl-carrier protein] reductase [Geomicrobium sp. JCM 19037]